MASPKDYGLPHDEWYPGQEDMIKWISETDGTLIVEAPTGSGKTGILAAQSKRKAVLALVRTKSLQQENYEEGYGFDTLYGKVNYPCVSPDTTYLTRADECIFPDNPRTCPQYPDCQYFQDRDRALASDKASLNYPYWMNVHSSWRSHSFLGCDEAHQLSEITLDRAGITIDETTQVKYGLPTFPLISSSRNTSISQAGKSPIDRTREYLGSCLRALESSIERDKLSSGSVDKREMRKKISLRDKMLASINALNISSEGWYIRSGPSVGKTGWGFIARPLTAKYHFPTYFMHPTWQLMVMSATIGNPEVFCEELGISEYSYRAMKSSWGPERRPVHALDVPRLGRKSPPSAYEKQADEIARAIRSVDNKWSGIIHTTSILEAGRIAKRLHSRGLHDRVFVPERKPTNHMLTDWQNRLKKIPNSIIVSWSMWEGYDGTDEKINIVAKTPYPYLGDAYEVERRNFNGKFYIQRAAWQLEQGLGRTRRGREEDYDTDDEERGFVAIADGGWKWVRKYMSKTVVEAIQI